MPLGIHEGCSGVLGVGQPPHPNVGVGLGDSTFSYYFDYLEVYVSLFLVRFLPSFLFYVLNAHFTSLAPFLSIFEKVCEIFTVKVELCKE